MQNISFAHWKMIKNFIYFNFLFHIMMADKIDIHSSRIIFSIIDVTY